MLEKLKDAEARYCELEELLASADVFSNQERFTATMKEYKSLTPVIEKYREYKSAESEMDDLRQMLDDTLDAEMRELANSEFKELKIKTETLLEDP